jgi:iron complex transport system ATP-binding protein
MSDIPQMRAQNVFLSYKEKQILKNISLTIPRGKISAIIGPNGSGKSTLLRILCGLVTPVEGNVYLGEKSISSYKQRAIATNIAFLPQRSVIPDNYSVLDLLKAGRFPHQGLIKKPSTHDKKIIGWSLEVTDMVHYQNHLLPQLSGGLQQRAWLAMVLCQETPIIVLDEPSTYLDIKHQLQLLELIRSLNLKYKKTILWVLHDLNHAIQTSDYLFIIKNGELIGQGNPESMIQSNLISETFEIEIKQSYFDEHIKLSESI